MTRDRTRRLVWYNTHITTHSLNRCCDSRVITQELAQTWPERPAKYKSRRHHSRTRGSKAVLVSHAHPGKSPMDALPPHGLRRHLTTGAFSVGLRRKRRGEIEPDEGTLPTPVAYTHLCWVTTEKSFGHNGRESTWKPYLIYDDLFYGPHSCWVEDMSLDQGRHDGRRHSRTCFRCQHQKCRRGSLSLIIVQNPSKPPCPLWTPCHRTQLANTRFRLASS